MSIYLVGFIVVMVLAIIVFLATLVDRKIHPIVPHDPTKDALLILREDGVIEFASHNAEQMFGWPEGAMVGMLLNELIPARFQAIHKQHVTNYFKGQPPHMYEMGMDLHGDLRKGIYGRRANGTEFLVEIGLAPTPKILDKLGVIALIREVSE